MSTAVQNRPGGAESSDRSKKKVRLTLKLRGNTRHGIRTVPVGFIDEPETARAVRELATGTRLVEVVFRSHCRHQLWGKLARIHPRTVHNTRLEHVGKVARKTGERRSQMKLARQRWIQVRHDDVHCRLRRSSDQRTRITPRRFFVSTETRSTSASSVTSNRSHEIGDGYSRSLFD